MQNAPVIENYRFTIAQRRGNDKFRIAEKESERPICAIETRYPSGGDVYRSDRAAVVMNGSDCAEAIHFNDRPLGNEATP